MDRATMSPSEGGSAPLNNNNHEAKTTPAAPAATSHRKAPTPGSFPSAGPLTRTPHTAGLYAPYPLGVYKETMARCQQGGAKEHSSPLESKGEGREGPAVALSAVRLALNLSV